jgi:hypothetical protein
LRTSNQSFFVSGTFFFGGRVLNSGPVPWATPQVLDGFFFKIGSLRLFVQHAFEPWSSWSLPPECLGLQVWITVTQLIWYISFIYITCLDPVIFWGGVVYMNRALYILGKYSISEVYSKPWS